MAIGLLGAGAAAMLAWNHWLDQREKADAPVAAWLPEPPGGMDATSRPVRHLLHLVAEGDLWRDCGRDDHGPAAERYAVRIGPDAWGPFLRMTVDVQDETLRVVITDASMPPAPPPPQPDRPATESPAAGPQPIRSPSPVRRFSLAREEMMAIREAWADPGLWLADQKEAALGCLDGNPVLLESCVRGRYVARYRNCDEAAYEPTARLWKLIESRYNLAADKP